MTAGLEKQFHAAMLGLHQQAKEAGYSASYFGRMVHEKGGVAAAKQLLAAQRPSNSFTQLDSPPT